MRTFAVYIAPPPTVAELRRLAELATRHHLTSYDAAYLDLAVRLGLPLATQDDALRKAAAASSVPLVQS